MDSLKLYARAGAHMLAFVVDLFLAQVLYSLLISMIPQTWQALAMVLEFFALFLYQSVTTIKYGATLGMLVFGLRLEPTDSDSASIVKLVIRALYFAIFFGLIAASDQLAETVAAIWGLGMMAESAAMVLDPKRRAIHDRLLGFAVTTKWKGSEVPIKPHTPIQTRRRNIAIIITTGITVIALAAATASTILGNDIALWGGAAISVVVALIATWAMRAKTNTTAQAVNKTGRRKSAGNP